jgi:hypothetical protein
LWAEGREKNRRITKTTARDREAVDKDRRKRRELRENNLE